MKLQRERIVKAVTIDASPLPPEQEMQTSEYHVLQIFTLWLSFTTKPNETTDFQPANIGINNVSEKSICQVLISTKHP